MDRHYPYDHPSFAGRALTDASGNKFVPDKNIAAFGASPIHITMLNYRVRTAAFIKGISEIIGNDPFGEHILPVFKDAEQRLLKQDARILPGQIKVFGLPVKVPASRLQNIILQQHDLDNWKEWYKVDLQILKDSVDLSQPLWKSRAEKLKDFEILDEPVLLAAVSSFSETVISNQVEGQAGDTFNGMLVYFEVVLGDTLLTSHPLAEHRAWHWLNLVWYLPEAEKLAAGDTFKVQYDYSGKKSALRLLQ